MICVVNKPMLLTGYHCSSSLTHNTVVLFKAYKVTLVWQCSTFTAVSLACTSALHQMQHALFTVRWTYLMSHDLLMALFTLNSCPLHYLFSFLFSNLTALMLIFVMFNQQSGNIRVCARDGQMVANSGCQCQSMTIEHCRIEVTCPLLGDLA